MRADTSAWANSQPLDGDVIDAVKRERRDVVIMGSLSIVHTLMASDLIDEYRLLTFPVHLGSGKKLFTDGAKAAALRLLSSSTTSTGVVIASYEPAGPVKYGSYALDES